MLCIEEQVEYALLRLPDDRWDRALRASVAARPQDAGPLPSTGSSLFDEFERQTWAELEEDGGE